MAKKEAPPEAELDEHGLIVHTYVSKVLVVVPPSGYDETTLRYARSALFNVHVQTALASTDDEGILPGAMQDMLQSDGLLADTGMAEFAGVIFVGGPGSLALAEHPDAQRLAREAMAAKKLVCAWGQSVLVLANAGVLKRRKVTGAPELREPLTKAGARFTGVQVQVDGNLVTAADDAAGFRMSKALVQVVSIR